jgi:hypothetical protein
VRVVAPPGGASNEEDWRGAEVAKDEKLRRNRLGRRAGARGFELRHSAYGYSLIDAKRNRIDDRDDLTLDEIESLLERA